MDIEKVFPKGILRPELFTAVVSTVTAFSVRVNLVDASTSSGAHFDGGRYGKGEVGEFVLIEGQQNLLLGRIIETKLPESDRKTVKPAQIGQPLDAVGNVQLLGSISMEDLQVTAGVESYPRIGDRVYAAPHKFVSMIPALMDADTEDENRVQICLGSVDVAQESKINIKPEKLFGRHCAILGATGGGKSWTTAKIIEESVKYNAKIILIDATGEYRDISNEYVEHCHLDDPVNIAVGSKPCSVPVTSFIESDFISLFDPAGKVQGPKLRAAIRSLRLAQLKPQIFPEGFIKKINQPKENVERAEREEGVSALLDDPRQPFDINKLVAQIEQECVYPDAFGPGRGQKDITRWGAEDGNFSHCLSLVSRINAILSSRAYRCVFSSTDAPVTNLIDDFSANDKRLLRICLSGLSYEFKAREIIANVLGRHLLNKARQGDYKDRPVVVVVDEAHNFLGRIYGQEDSATKLDAFEIIAKEGRKYGLNICLTTQRPRDVTEGVLSQIGTLLVHRLTNDKDREVVERACGEIDRAASSFLPNLKPGEAALIGVDFPIPMTIQVEEPYAKPQSSGPDYQKSWKTKNMAK